MTPIQLISPVDGSVYAERMPLARDAAFAMAARAKAAQPAWAARPLAERIALVKAAVAALNAMAPRVVEELAWQMGRPVRYGAGELRGFEERARLVASAAPGMKERSAAIGELITREMGKPLAQTHRALDDVMALVEIFQKELLWQVV